MQRQNFVYSFYLIKGERVCEQYLQEENKRKVGVMTQKEIEKVNYILKRIYNIFHADLITRAVQNDRITVEQFKVACGVIAMAERSGDDEFVPKIWEEV